MDLCADEIVAIFQVGGVPRRTCQGSLAHLPGFPGTLARVPWHRAPLGSRRLRKFEGGSNSFVASSLRS
eukprot:8646102-Pyramimonas_sp.AAC.2